MTQGLILIVDDDAGVRGSLSALLGAAGFGTKCYASAEDCLADCLVDEAGCMILDVAMPGMRGPELADALAERGVEVPIIFLTAFGDIRMSVDAMKKGAVDFLEKPVDSNALLQRVEEALARSRTRRDARMASTDAHEKLRHLTTREREVLLLAVTGVTNKVIARSLNISHRTAELHRARAMKKLGVRSLLDALKVIRAADETLPAATETSDATKQTAIG
jgi:FixJ family two-component response regulator